MGKRGSCGLFQTRGGVFKERLVSEVKIRLPRQLRGSRRREENSTGSYYFVQRMREKTQLSTQNNGGKREEVSQGETGKGACPIAELSQSRGGGGKKERGLEGALSTKKRKSLGDPHLFTNR